MTKPVYWSPLSFAQSLRVISWVRQWDIDKFINVYNKFFPYLCRKWRVQIWILGYGCQIELSNICLFIKVRIFYLSKSINYMTNLFSKTWWKTTVFRDQCFQEFGPWSRFPESGSNPDPSSDKVFWWQFFFLFEFTIKTIFKNFIFASETTTKDVLASGEASSPTEKSSNMKFFIFFPFLGENFGLPDDVMKWCRGMCINFTNILWFVLHVIFRLAKLVSELRQYGINVRCKKK